MSPLKPFLLVSVIAIGLMGLLRTSEAEIYPFDNLYNNLTKEDLHLLRMGVRPLLRTGVVGSTTSWNNKLSDNSGTIKLARIFSRNGFHCREIDHIIKFKGEQDVRHYQMTYCRIGNRWKIAH